MVSGSAYNAVEGAVGLGVDIVEIARMRAILKRTPRFRLRVFSEDERAYCDRTSLPEVHYATRFAAKEAVLKALGTGFSQGIRVLDVEVRRNVKGRPYVVLSGRAKEIADEQGVRELPLSLSYTHTDAVACALAITDDSVRAAAERVNPLEELAKQFKEARKMLDELDVPSSPDAEVELHVSAREVTSETAAPVTGSDLNTISVAGSCLDTTSVAGSDLGTVPVAGYDLGTAPAVDPT